MDWIIYLGIGVALAFYGYKVVRWQAGREVQLGSFLVGVFLIGMGTTLLLQRLNDHDGLAGKITDEPERVMVYRMTEEQICFLILDTEDKGCAPRSDLVGLDWALRATSFIGPTFEIRRLEENGVYRGVEILNPHNQNQVQQ